jgi:hypothetical protein
MGMFGTASMAGRVAIAAALLLGGAASAAKPRRGAHAVAAAPTLDAFTPASGDPRIAAAFARSGLGTGTLSGGAFRFTPSGGMANRRAVTVAVRAHVITRQDAAKALSIASAQIAPSAYSLGASVGWKHFALSGDVAKVDGGLLPIGRESADVGFSFTGKRWAGKVDLAGERALANQPAFGIDQNWSVGLGGSYALTRNLDVSGGVRYKTERDEMFSLTDTRHDSQAVYLGTTFKF